MGVAPGSCISTLPHIPILDPSHAILQVAQDWPGALCKASVVQLWSIFTTFVVCASTLCCGIN